MQLKAPLLSFVIIVRWLILTWWVLLCPNQSWVGLRMVISPSIAERYSRQPYSQEGRAPVFSLISAVQQASNFLKGLLRQESSEMGPRFLGSSYLFFLALVLGRFWPSSIQMERPHPSAGW